mmetsp:Transcript_80876/g.255199  ORF Transcript_80876/g.255199 Transcript_80876/m.255199 type:complete len:235 (+) Transcript_80876:292-996(+)
MEDMLLRVTLHGEDGLDSEDGAPLRRQPADGLHPGAEASGDDLALAHDREGVHAGVVPAPLGRLAVAGSVGGAVASAVARAVAAAVATLMPAASMALCAVFVVAVASAMASGLFMAMLQLSCDLRLPLYVLVHEVRHVVSTDVRELCELDPGLHSRQDLGKLVDVTDSVPHSNCLISGDEVQLVKDNLVRKRQLLVGLIDLALLDLVVQAPQDVLCICHGHDSIEAQLRRQLRI